MSVADILAAGFLCLLVASCGTAAYAVVRMNDRVALAAFVLIILAVCCFFLGAYLA